eukprot:7830023-Ditylum_brightwellii.AAC.1
MVVTSGLSPASLLHKAWDKLVPSPDTTTEEIVRMTQEEVDLYTGLAQATDGQVSSDVEKNC